MIMKKKFSTIVSVVLALCLALSLMNMYGLAEGTPQLTAPAADPSPAIYVTQKTAQSVVGVLVSRETWDRQNGTQVTPIASGSGVCIAEGGYIVTNNHVVSAGGTVGENFTYQVLMPDGEYVDAILVGADSSTDLAVLKVDEKAAEQLVPVDMGSTEDLLVGSTVVAIGNPGGDELANTVTQGIVSALKRNVNGSNTTRRIYYIQHDAAINEGNSGGGLFNYRGELVGINTLKMGNSSMQVSTEGLGFAIPVETMLNITTDLIEHGRVIRPQMGVTVLEHTDGPDEPMNSYAPVSVMVYTVNEGSPAEQAGVKQYDFIYAVDGVRVTSFSELTYELDQHQAGDTVTLTLVRYAQVQVVDNAAMSSFYGFNNGGMTSGYSIFVSGGYEFVTADVTLQILDN